MQETENNENAPANQNHDEIIVGKTARELPWLEQVEALALAVSEKAGCILYDVDFVGAGSGKTLRVFIDKTEAPIGIEECTYVTNGLNELLDAKPDLIPVEHYNLEVSSPGVDRVLKKRWHFEKSVGKKIWIKLKQPLATFGVEDKKWVSAKQLDETLVAVQDDQLVFNPKGLEIKVPLAAIDKAHVVFVFEKGKKK